MSIYREEAIDTLISCLRNNDFPATQVVAAETVVSLQGRFNFAGKPLIREVLLNRAGFNKNRRSLDQMDHISNISGELEMNPVYFSKSLLLCFEFLILLVKHLF